MKLAAAVGIFCLFVTVVNGATFSVLSVINEVDGQPVIQCSVKRGGKTYTLNVGEEVRLPSIKGSFCMDCGPCDETGMSCRDLYQGAPGCPSYVQPKRRPKPRPRPRPRPTSPTE